MAFTILTGKTLAKAIKGFGQKVATFTQLQHQLAASALAHVEEHHCASHLNALFAATPANYRAALRVWSTHFGKVKFVAEPAEAGAHFTYDKAGKSDMPGALAVSPAEFVKGKTGEAAAPFDEVAAFEALAKRLADKGGSARAIELANAAIRALKTPVAAPAAAPKKPKAEKPAAPALVVDNGTPAPAGWSKIEAGTDAAAQGALELAA